MTIMTQAKLATFVAFFATRLTHTGNSHLWLKLDKTEQLNIGIFDLFYSSNRLF